MGRAGEVIVDKLEARAPESSICPSEVARELWPGDEWRSRMPEVRRAAAQLAAEGTVRITQKDTEVDASKIEEVRGPVRIRRGPRWR